MNEKRRNLMVGLTVIVGFAILAAMVVIFQQLPGFLRLGTDVNVTFPDTGGATVGSDVWLVGKRVGRVSAVEFTDGDPAKGVTLTLSFDRGVSIPGQVNAYSHKSNFMGGTGVELRVDGQPPGSERTGPSGEKLQFLPAGITFAGRVASDGGGILPPELVSETRVALASLKKLADNLGVLFEPSTETAPAGRPPSIFVSLAKMNTALDSVNVVLGDKDNQQNIKATLANLKVATAAGIEAVAQVKSTLAKADVTFDTVNDFAKKASVDVNKLMVALIDDSDRLGKILTDMHHVLSKIDEGQGSAGKLLNDPALYNSLVDASNQLRNSLTAFDELLKSWKANGIPLKLK